MLVIGWRWHNFVIRILATTQLVGPPESPRWSVTFIFMSVGVAAIHPVVFINIPLLRLIMPAQPALDIGGYLSHQRSRTWTQRAHRRGIHTGTFSTRKCLVE